MLPKIVVLAGLCLSLAGCGTLPRGAGLQSEVLAGAATATEDAPAAAILTEGFAVERVMRDNLAVFAAWPAIGEPRLRWIERAEQPANRIIAPGDRVSVTIWTTEENGLMTAGGQRSIALPDMQVSSGGSIHLPYAGEVRVAGMAPETARARIEERYVEVIPSAQVQFSFEEGRQNTVSVVAGAGAPGVYPLANRNVTILEMLAEAGGAAPALNNPQIRLRRGGDLYGTSLARVLENPRLNPTLLGGDQIHLEEDARRFISLGAAGTEAMHEFPKDRLSALEAMSLVGGLAENRANAQGILILRQYPASAVRADRTGPAHERAIFVIDLTSADGLFSAGQFDIRAGDVIYVTESPVNAARTVFALIGSVFGLVNQVN